MNARATQWQRLATPRGLIWSALVAVVTIGFVASICATARADGPAPTQVVIEVVPVGAVASYAYELSELPGSPGPDVEDQSYSNIAAAGGSPQTLTVTSGYSLGLVISSVDPGTSFAFAEVQQLGDPSVLLTNAQATIADGPPVLWQDGQGRLHVLIPSTGPGRANAGVSFIVMQEELFIYLHSGSILSVGISTLKQKVAVGKPLRFTAAVNGAAPGTTLSYTWEFGDGSGGSQAPISHTYIAPGTYDAYLKVTGSGDSLGFSKVIPITVGKAQKGPDRRGGGTKKKKTAPTSGAGVKGSGGKQSTAKKGTTTTTTTTTFTTATASKTPTTAATTTTAENPTVKLAGSHHTAVKRAPRPTGPLLSGVALSGARVRPARATPTASARPGAPNPARAGRLTSPGRGIGERIWIALGALVALLGGALLQAYGSPRRSWVPHLPELRGGTPGLR